MRTETEQVPQPVLDIPRFCSVLGVSAVLIPASNLARPDRPNGRVPRPGRSGVGEAIGGRLPRQ